MPQTLLETFISYVPPLVTRRIAARAAPLHAPLREHFPAAALFADISGFTPLTETLARRGPAGAEELSRLLNNYFTQLIDLITAHGGEVVKFAGDALLALWPVEKDEVGRIKDEGGKSQVESSSSSFIIHPSSLQEATLHAAQCGLKIQSALHNYQALPDVSLSMRIGIGVGDLTTDHVGGKLGRWEIVLSGAPLVQMSIAKRCAQPGEVVLSPEAWALVADQCQSTHREAGYVRLDAVREPAPASPALAPNLPPEAESALRVYIPGAILGRLLAGHTGWLAELRRVTVLFINPSALSADTPLEQVQVTLQRLQSAIYHYEGSINKISVDDKGITLVAAQGLPPLAHEDDATRGVQAALAIRGELKALGLTAAIGIATGHAFCGSVGSPQRREYTMIGNVVNLAARLMEAASVLAAASNNSETVTILCDEATYQVAQAQISFETLPKMMLKGRAEPVSVFRPLASKKTAIRPKAALVGRAEERAVLSDALQSLLRNNPRDVVVEGEAGIGKSRLVEELLRQAQALGVTSLIGAADAVDKFTAYYAWRPIFMELFELEIYGEVTEEERQRLNAYFESDAELKPLAPLAAVVLPLDLPDNELTAQMSGEARASKTNDLLVAIFRAAMQREGPVPRPTLVILEDAHWLDSASWMLVHRLRREGFPLMLVIATRPLAESQAADYRQLLESPDTLHLRLDSLSPADTYALVCQRLGVAGLPESVADLIRDRAEGHPFFSEELVYALRDAGLIHIAEGKCWIDPRAGDLKALDFPDSVQGVITSRIDRLTPQQQLTLKVASVIGRAFAFGILCQVHPIEADRPHLTEYLSTLDRLDITPVETPEPDLTYLFKHIITQEVAYNLMAFAQRQQLHQAIAEWYENTYADDLTQYFPLLAHHWSKADKAAKTIYYLEQASTQALKNNANREATRFLTEALSLLDKQPATPDSAGQSSDDQLQRARLERQLADAYYGLGQLVESRDHYQKALALLGWPVPESPAKLGMALFRELGRQTWYQLGPGRETSAHPANDEARQTRLLEGYRAYERLSEVFFLNNDTLLTVYGTFAGLNLAEAIGPSPELARGFASVCVAAGLIPLTGVAQHYERLARQTIQNTPDLPALGQTLMVLSVYTIGVGQWRKSQESTTQALELFEHLGYLDRSETCLELLAAIAYYQGQLSQAIDFANRLTLSARRRGNAVHSAWGLLDQATCRLRQGDVEQAVAWAEEALNLLKQSADLTTEIRAEGLLALGRLFQNDLVQARQGADKAAKLIAAQPQPTSFNVFDGYTGLTEVYLALWERDPAAADDDLKRHAAQGCRLMHKYARIFPIGGPRAWLYQGRLDWLANRPAAAHRAWQQSLAHAERLGMRLEAGLAHFEIARHLSADEAHRQNHLREASELFEQLGTKQPL